MVHLNGKNYSSWAFQLKIFVTGKDLWGHIDGSNPTPNEATHKEEHVKWGHIVLALATSQSWPLYQLDVKNAFLHGDLKEEFYIKLPIGMITPLSNDVCKLKRSLYGLKQTPRVWFEKFRSTLFGFSFTQS